MNIIQNIMNSPEMFNKQLVARIKNNFTLSNNILSNKFNVNIPKAKIMKNVHKPVSHNVGQLGRELYQQSFGNNHKPTDNAVSLYQTYYRKVEDRYECELCEYKAKHKSSIINHRNKNHDINHIYKYKCKLCDNYKTDNKRIFRRHIQNNHSDKMHLFDEKLNEIAEVQEDRRRNVIRK